MKKVIIFLVVIVFSSSMLFASQHEITKNVDDLKVKVLLDNDPPLKGDNNLNILLTDSNGNPVSKAKIKVDYSMAPMGDMPPMSYKSRAKFKGESYKATINLSMSGQWNVNMNIKRPGKPLSKVKIEFKVP